MLGYKLSENEKKLAVLTVVLIIAACSYNFILEPAASLWRSLNKQIKDKTILLAHNYKLLENYESLEQEYANYHSYMDKAGAEPDLVLTLQEIERISEKSLCRIINIKPVSSQEMNSRREALLDITIEGTVNNLSHFLYELESWESPLRVKSFSLAPIAQSPGELRVFLQLKKIVFIHP